MSNVTTYINYFKNHAVKHSEIQHDILTEDGGGDPDRKRFTVFGNNEVVSGLRNQIVFPALCLELYDNNLEGQDYYNIRHKPRGAFMVLNRFELQNFADEQRAYDNAEKIMYDILQKTWQDHYGKGKDQCTTPFLSFDFTRIEITPTGLLFTNCVGWYVQFNFQLKNTINIAQAPADGVFLP